MRSTPHCLRRSSMKSATVFAMWRSSRQLFLPLLRPPFRWPSLLPPPLPPVCFFPPFLEAPDVLEILAARSLLMPFLRRPSYCLSLLTLEPWSLAIVNLPVSGVVPLPGRAGDNRNSLVPSRPISCVGARLVPGASRLRGGDFPCGLRLP